MAIVAVLVKYGTPVGGDLPPSQTVVPLSAVKRYGPFSIVAGVEIGGIEVTTWMSVMESFDAAVRFVEVSSANCSLGSTSCLLLLNGDASDGMLTFSVNGLAVSVTKTVVTLLQLELILHSESAKMNKLF